MNASNDGSQLPETTAAFFTVELPLGTMHRAMLAFSWMTFKAVVPGTSRKFQVMEHGALDITSRTLSAVEFPAGATHRPEPMLVIA
jgi:hypothetical protein